MANLNDEIAKLKLELTTVIMGYERELLQCKRDDISEFSKGCMERYYNLIIELKKDQNA